MILHFSSLTRIIFLSIISLLFLITASFLIGYAFGYRYNFERGIFVHSGSITIKSNPSRVDVSIDGKKIDKKKINYINGANQIDGLRPGTYDLEISAPNFKPWTKSVVVESGKSSEFWNILLVQESYETKKFPLSTITGIFPSPDGKKLALSHTKENEMFVTLFTISSEETEQVFSSITYNRPKNWKTNIEWSPDSKKLLIPTKKITEMGQEASQEVFPDEVFFVDIETLETKALSEEITAPFRDVRWGFEDDTLFALKDSELILLTQNKDKTFTKDIFTQDIIAYDISSSTIFTLKTNGILYKIEKNSKTEQQITTSQFEKFSPSDIISLIVYDERRFVMKSLQGILWIWNHGEKNIYIHTIDENIQGAQFSNDGKKLLYWNTNAIWTYFLREWDVQPKREENSFLSLANFSSHISNVSWTKQYEHILYTFQDKIHITELDHRNQRITTTLSPTVAEDPLIIQNFSNDLIFFTSPENETNSLSSFVFAKLPGLFAF